jgi:hypothetical protein
LRPSLTSHCFNKQTTDFFWNGNNSEHSLARFRSLGDM